MISNEYLSLANIHAFRLERHHLNRRAPRSEIETVVKDIGGVQAQLDSAARIAIWTRVQGLGQKDIDNALWHSRVLVKTWCMRGTLHFLAASDLPGYVNAIKNSGLNAARRWLMGHGIGPEDFEVISGAITDILVSGPLTKKELVEHIVERLGSKVKPMLEGVWGDLVKIPAMEGLICFGPKREKEVTYALQDQWVGKKPDLDEKEARSWLFCKYISSFGPATIQDFSKWSGLLVKETRTIIEGLSDELIEIDLNGSKNFLLEKDLDVIRSMDIQEGSVCLLPSFDTYILGHQNKDHLIEKKFYKQVYRRAGWLSPVVLLDGRIVGIWSYRLKGKKLNVDFDLFKPVKQKIHDQIKREVSDLGRFIDVEAKIQLRI